MASTINAISGGAGGLTSKGDASGALNIQTAGTTAIAISSSQNVTFSGTLNVFGSGQTWTSFNSSARVLGTTYTNTSGKPIQVSVTGILNAAILTGMYLAVNGAVISQSPYAPSGGWPLNVSAVVPAGATYLASSSNGNLNFGSWSELR
jgi:hypothetical protein